MTIHAEVNIGPTYGSPWGTSASYSLANLTDLILTSAGVIAGIITLFLILFGGFKIISGASNNDPRATAQGQQAITWAIIGFVLMFGAYWIIRIVELILGVGIITNPYSML